MRKPSAVAAMEDASGGPTSAGIRAHPETCVLSRVLGVKFGHCNVWGTAVCMGHVNEIIKHHPALPIAQPTTCVVYALSRSTTEASCTSHCCRNALRHNSRAASLLTRQTSWLQEYAQADSNGVPRSLVQ